MPCFKDIEVTIHSTSENKKLPEFPHPDTNPAGPREPEGARHGNAQASPANGAPATAKDKTRPMSSVYIPCLPGVQFSVRYAVKLSPEQSPYVFFRMSMNGRRVTSWGIKLSRESTGSVGRALFEPGDRHVHTEENGVALRRVGIESRHFYFVTTMENRSVAEEGGLIEIQAFRARRRRARAPKLDRFRSQEEYGICAPSAGLVDNPEELKFFDFLLSDHRDFPYAIFRFHYRSWENLEQLNLIPETSLEVPSAGAGICSSGAAEDLAPVSAREAQDRSFSRGIDLLDEAIFGDKSAVSEDTSELAMEDQSDSSSGLLRNPPALRPSSPLNGRVPQPSKALRDSSRSSYLQRPLPDLPKEPETENPPRYPRRSSSLSSRTPSNGSQAPSITPSLLPFVEDESLFREDPVVVQATQVLIRSESRVSPVSCGDSPQAGADDSSDYERSPLASARSKMARLLSPGNYLATSGSTLERELDLLASPSPIQGPESPSRMLVKARQILGDEADELPNSGAFNPPEAQWLRGNPSTTRDKISRMWSPRPKRPARALFTNSLRLSRTRSRSKMRDSDVARSGSTDGLLEQGDARRKSGSEQDEPRDRSGSEQDEPLETGRSWLV